MMVSQPNFTRLSSLKGKEKDVSKKLIYIQQHKDRRYRSAQKTELNQTRSKPDIVDRRVRTARIFVQHYNCTQYYNTETVFPILPFLHTNIAFQMKFEENTDLKL